MWREFEGDPASGDDELLDEPATAAWVRVGRPLLRVDEREEPRRRFAWEVVCGEDRVVATGEDTVELCQRDAYPDAAVLAAVGGE